MAINVVPTAAAARAPTLTDPGAFVLIGTEYDVVVARTITITATAACLIGPIPDELITLSLSLSVGAGASPDFDDYYVVAALEGSIYHRYC